MTAPSTELLGEPIVKLAPGTNIALAAAAESQDTVDAEDKAT